MIHRLALAKSELPTDEADAVDDGSMASEISNYLTYSFVSSTIKISLF